MCGLWDNVFPENKYIFDIFENDSLPIDRYVIGVIDHKTDV